MPVFKRTLKLLAGIFGVDLVELAADSADDPKRATDEFLHRMQENVAMQDFQEVEEAALESSSVDAMLEHLAWRNPPIDKLGRLVDDAELEYLATDRLDVARLLDADALVDEVERRDLEDEFDQGPLKEIHELEDDPTSVYLHLLEAGADQGAYADRLDAIYREEFGRSPRAMHVPMNEVRELREVDPAYFTQQAAPWLKEAEREWNDGIEEADTGEPNVEVEELPEDGGSPARGD